MTNDRRLLRYSVRRRGVILFIVTVVIAMASLAAYGFVVTMQGENQAAHASADQLQASQVAASGEEFMAAWLQASRRERSSDIGLLGDALFARQVRAPDQADDVPPVGAFHIVVPELATDRLNGQRFPFDGSNEGSAFRYSFDNESAKLHLRTLLAWDAEWPGSARHALLQLPEMSESIADAMLDWIDSDDMTREFGAERDYYRSLARPDAPRNAVPSSLEDLLRVRGVTRRLLIGVAASSPPPVAGAIREPHADSLHPAEDFRPWQNFLTVHGAERNETIDGLARIHVNHNVLASLHRALLDVVPADVADFIIFFRQFGPLQTDGTRGTATQPRPNLDLTQPASHEIAKLADLIAATVRVPSAANDSSGTESNDDHRDLASPFAAGSASAGEIDEWLDHLTVSKEKIIVGRINILAARPEVLRGLPHAGPVAAERILSRRDQSTHASGASNTTATVDAGTSWLYTEGILDTDAFRDLAPFLTTGGAVARFQVVAGLAMRKHFQRYEVVLDGTVANSPRVYFRDLRRFGTPRLFEMFNRRSVPFSAGSGEVRFP